MDFGKLVDSCRSKTNSRQDDDLVNYTYKGWREKQKRRYQNEPCYGSIMDKLGKGEIECYDLPTKDTNDAFDPYFYGGDGEPTGLKPADFLEFGRLLKRAGIAPREVSFTNSKLRGNRMRIPASVKNPHLVYILLCLYRWQSSEPAYALATMRLYRKLRAKDPRYPFLQVLHYGLCQGNMDDGHGFVYGNEYGNDLGWGWAFAKFVADATKDKKLTKRQARYELGTAVLLTKLVAQVRGTTYDPSTGNLMGLLEDPDDLLRSKFSKLYRRPQDWNKTKFAKLVEQE